MHKGYKSIFTYVYTYETIMTIEIMNASVTPRSFPVPLSKPSLPNSCFLLSSGNHRCVSCHYTPVCIF